MTRVDVEQLGAEPLRYVATLRASLELTIRTGAIPYRYRGLVAIPLRLTVATRDDLKIFIEVDEISPTDADVDLQPAGRAGAFVAQIGQVAEQVQEQIAPIVNERTSRAGIMEQRVIDVGPTIDAEWARRRPGGS